jgi:hypothetical protein
MNRIVIFLLLSAGALVQTAVPKWNAFGGVDLPLLNALVIFVALHASHSRTVFAAVLAGLLHDAFCPAPLGLSIPFFVMLAAGSFWIREEVFGDMPLTYAILGGSAALLETFYYSLIFGLGGLRPIGAGPVALRLTGALLAGTVTVPLMAMVLLQFSTLTGSRRRRRMP